MSGSLAAMQAERDVLLRSARERDAELASLRQQAQRQQGSLDLEIDRSNRELEALRAQLQQQVMYTLTTKTEPPMRRRGLSLETVSHTHQNSTVNKALNYFHC